MKMLKMLAILPTIIAKIKETPTERPVLDCIEIIKGKIGNEGLVFILRMIADVCEDKELCKILSGVFSGEKEQVRRTT